MMQLKYTGDPWEDVFKAEVRSIADELRANTRIEVS